MRMRPRLLAFSVAAVALALILRPLLCAAVYLLAL